VKYTAKEIGEILVQPDLKGLIASLITEISIDSRRIVTPSETLFFALPGELHDGHDFVETAYDRGVRNFVVSRSDFSEKYPKANFYKVENVLTALQRLATVHRESFPKLKKIGITGSNGKTIIKEWLYQMLHDVYHIVKSPKSYNSQIGMALSLLAIEEGHELGIFEAGISRTLEMGKHRDMLDPEIGLITNIGSAHDEGFSSHQDKLAEKMILFQNAETIIFKKDDHIINDFVTSEYSDKELFSWGTSEFADVRIVTSVVEDANRIIEVQYKKEKEEIKLRYTDMASLENCMHCVAVMCLLGLSLKEIKNRIHRISGLHMRMEMTTGIDQSILINDAYSADLDAFQIALEFVKQQAGNRQKMAILGAFEQSGKDEQFVFNKIIEQLVNFGFKDLVYISVRKFEKLDDRINVQLYSSKSEVLDNIHSLDVSQKAVLIKGARHHGLEDISDRLSDKGHSATLQINLTALENNLRTYKKYLQDNVDIIAVVKASAYGTGSSEVAQLLERNGVNHLAVAFADEGIALRQSGIAARIMVFNPDLRSLPDIIRYRLEPEIYGLEQLEQIVNYSNHNNTPINIHLKLDTGMHRLGFLRGDMKPLCHLLSNADHVNVPTIFSHLASSEDEGEDDYSRNQFNEFDEMYETICSSLKRKPKRHILNSGGISRFPDRQYDFVRLGIGMYGIDNNPAIQNSLRKVHRLYASLIQIKKMKKGDSIGYNRRTILTEDTVIGIVNIGYADGVMRNLGNRKYSYLVHGRKVNIIGNVCMDVTIVDLTNVPEVKVGDQVVVFDDSHSIEELASAAGTIPYEILSRISSRVNRTFVRE